MAKKRKKSEKEAEEEYEFKPPEFDEKDFLRKELADTRAVVFTVVYAVALGVVAGALSAADRAFVGPSFLIVIGGLFSLPYVYPLAKVDTKTFQKKNWLGNIGTFFFTFLAIWILVLNQPFADLARPTINNFTVWVEKPGNLTAIDYKANKTNGVFEWIPRYGESLGTVVTLNSTLNLTAKVADNDHLKSVQISIVGTDYRGMSFEGKNRWGYKMNATDPLLATGKLTFGISAQDDAGNQAVFFPTGTITIPTA